MSSLFFKNFYWLIKSYINILFCFYPSFYNIYDREDKEKNIIDIPNIIDIKNKDKKVYECFECFECLNRIKNDLYFAMDKSFCTNTCRTNYIYRDKDKCYISLY